MVYIERMKTSICAIGDYAPGYDITIVSMVAEMLVNTNRISILMLKRSVIIITCLSSNIIVVQAIDILVMGLYLANPIVHLKNMDS